MNTIKKMNKFIAMAAVVSSLCFASCASDGDLSDSLDAAKDKINSPADVAFGGNITTASFDIKASGLWNITGKPDWFNLSATQGMGDATITITTIDSENPSALENRTATLTINTDTRTRQLSVVQTPAKEILEIVQDSVKFMRTSTSLTSEIMINNNSKWEILEHPDWFTVSPMSGEGSATVIVEVKKMESDWDNSDIMTVKSSNLQEQVVIFQQGIETFLSVSPNAIAATAIEGNYTIMLDGDASWIASTDAGWTSLSKLQGKGTEALNVLCTTNETSGDREANITIETNSKVFTCKITQSVAALPECEKPEAVKVEKYGFTVSSTFSSEIPVSEYGIVYSSTNTEPTIGDVKVPCTDGTNPFTIAVGNLKSGLKFYVRSYARSGAGINYSETLEVTTGGSKPNEDDNPTPNV